MGITLNSAMHWSLWRAREKLKPEYDSTKTVALLPTMSPIVSAGLWKIPLTKKPCGTSENRLSLGTTTGKGMTITLKRVTCSA